MSFRRSDVFLQQTGADAEWWVRPDRLYLWLCLLEGKCPLSLSKWTRSKSCPLSEHVASLRLCPDGQDLTLTLVPSLRLQGTLTMKLLLVPYVPSDEGKRRSGYYEALWKKIKNSDIEYKRIVQVPKLGADPKRRNPQFVSHLRQCLEERDKGKNIELRWCQERQQQVGFVIIDYSVLFLELIS